MMTPEERFTKIENLLNSMTEHHAHFADELEIQRVRHDREIADIRELQNVFAIGMIRLQDGASRLEAAQERSQKEMEKLREAQRVSEEKLREAQRVTEEKLNALIDTVDRIIRNRNT